MKETIILAPSADGTELLRMFARYGKNTLGVRVMGAVELSRYALMQSGIGITREYISALEESMVYDSFLREIPYFESASYNDAKEMAVQMRNLRHLIKGDEMAVLEEKLSCGEFSEKNEAVLEGFHKYLEILEERNRIDSVGILRLAMNCAKPFAAEFLIFCEYPLSPLERELLSHISGGKFEEVHIAAYLEAAEKPIHIEAYTECYGVVNEIEHIIGYIYKNNIPLDQCQIVAARPSEYAGVLLSYMGQYHIPVASGGGFPIVSSNPAKLLKLYSEWNTAGYHGVDALKNMIFSEAFNRELLFEKLGEGMEMKRFLDIIQAAGELRLSPDGDLNREKIQGYARSGKNGALVPYLTLLDGELSKSASYFISTYSVARKSGNGSIDQAAANTISRMLDLHAELSSISDLEEMIPAILSLSVGKELSREGALYVTGVENALSSLRDNVFLAGFAADSFPGKPSENYLILDKDYALFEEDVPTSENRIRKRKESLYALVKAASSLGAKIHVSYAGYRLADIKEENASSVLFELYRMEHGEGSRMDEFERALHHGGFFDYQLSPEYSIGRAYIAGEEISHGREQVEEQEELEAFGTFSPTAVETYLLCPRKFYLAKLLGIREPEEDDPFVVIDAKMTGSLIHELMEEYNGQYDRESFIKKASDIFDQFMLVRPPIHDGDAAKEKKQFLAMAENAFETDPGNEHIASEKIVSAKHDSGIALTGRLDRLERDADGKYIIVDYKTGRYIKHEEDDAVTCIQALIYAYMLEQEGIPVDHCEYRYVRQRETISCIYDSRRKSIVGEVLRELKADLDAMHFPCTDEQDNCRFCRFGEICGRNQEGGVQA